MANDSTDPTAVWAYSKVNPGWYMAKAVWDQKYAEQLQAMGYRVERSIDKPTSI